MIWSGSDRGNKVMKTVHSRYLAINSHAQRGTAALLISLVILTLITFVSLYTSKTVVVEQQISGNEYRSRVAFEAAEAGLAAALTYAEVDPDRDNDGVISDELIFDNAASPADRRVQMSGVGANNTKAFTNNSQVVVRLDGTTTQVDITSLGISGDGSATRTITETIEVLDPLPNFPAQPYTARGTVTVSGNAQIYNPEGRTTVLTGENYDMTVGGAAAQTYIADKNHANDPDCLGGSNKCIDPNYSGKFGCGTGETGSATSTINVKCDVVVSSSTAIQGIDIIEYDGNLANLDAEDYFFNFFGLKKSTFKARMAPRVVPAADFENDYDDATNPGVHGARGEVIWVDGDVNSQTIIAGCDYDMSVAAAVPLEIPIMCCHRLLSLSMATWR
jgi:Tfp pilus assembly protein PilX